MKTICFGRVTKSNVLLLVIGMTVCNILWFTYSSIQVNEEYDGEEVDVANKQPVLGRVKATRPTGPPKLLILSYQRSGSTFLGDLFGKNPDVFYMYEPLDALYMALYGSGDGWNVPTDITNYNNGTPRTIPTYESTAISQYLDNMFNCRVSDLPVEVWHHGYWRQFKKEQKSLDKVARCLNHSLKDTPICAAILKEVCNERFDATDDIKTRHCFQKLKEIRENSDNLNDYKGVFKQHRKCLTSVQNKLLKCVSKLADLCSNASLKIIKTVRMTAKSLEYLIDNNPDLRVIHLIRDPRGVLLSRSKLLSTYGLYSEMLPKSTFAGGYELYARLHRIENGKIAKPGRMDFTREARMFCHSLLNDLIVVKRLMSRYPDIIRQVVYEEFVENPTTIIRELYHFARVPFHNVRLPTTTKDSNHIAHKWRTQLVDAISDSITVECEGVYEQVASEAWMIEDI